MTIHPVLGRGQSRFCPRAGGILVISKGRQQGTASFSREGTASFCPRSLECQNGTNARSWHRRCVLGGTPAAPVRKLFASAIGSVEPAGKPHSVPRPSVWRSLSGQPCFLLSIISRPRRASPVLGGRVCFAFHSRFDTGESDSRWTPARRIRPWDLPRSTHPPEWRKVVPTGPVSELEGRGSRHQTLSLSGPTKRIRK